MAMPYHHNNGFRIPRFLIVTIAATVSIGIGAFTGHTLGDAQATSDYAAAIQKINQSIESQLERAVDQSVAAQQVTSARGQIDAAKTYQGSLAAIDKLRVSLETFNGVALRECSATGEHIANLDLTSVIQSNRIPHNVREGFTNLRETAAEDNACEYAHSLVAYNNFSTFTLGAAANVKQINASQFEDEAAIKNLQTLLKKAPTTAEIHNLEKKYGTDFTGYVKAHSELVKSYTSILTAKTAEELALYGERIQANNEKLQSLYDKSAKAYSEASLKDSEASLERTQRLYSEATIINKMPGGPKVNEAQLSGAIIINALTAYTQETGAYPTSQSLETLLLTLKEKKYVSDLAQFRSLKYIRDSSTGAYELTIPGTDGNIVITFTDKNTKPDKRTQTFKVQT